MKKFIYVIGLVSVAGFLAFTLLAQSGTGTARYEYAVVKWDGPDRLFYNLPNKFYWVHLEKEGSAIPKEAQSEEYCLALAANLMAKEGWEPINLDSRRILFRRTAR